MLLVIIDQMRTASGWILPKTPLVKANHKTYSTSTRATTIWPMIALHYMSITITVIQSTTIPEFL
jgi:hypothetical protein